MIFGRQVFFAVEIQLLFDNLHAVPKTERNLTDNSENSIDSTIAILLSISLQQYVLQVEETQVIVSSFQLTDHISV